MAAAQNSVSADGGTGSGNLLSSIRTDHNREESERKALAAASELISLLDPDRYVGDLISMDYDTAEVLIHDRLRQDVGGVPHGCLLLATRIRPDSEPSDLNDAQTSLILLRALKSSPLPNDVEMKHARLEAGQRAAQTSDNWDEGGKTDQFTLDQMRYAGAHCRILGTFRMNCDVETGVWKLEYGGDIDNFYAGQGMKVYKPAGPALERIVNYTRRASASSDPVEIGRLRYAASIRNPDAPESVPIHMMAEDLLAQRTALFGMTRTGKSNTTKTIASAVFRLRTAENGQRVGQLIFDPNGEYANENPQDQGCLRNIANIGKNFADDVVTYGLQPHPNDPDRNITKFNFFGDDMPRGRNPGKRELDEALQSLYQGKQIINEALRGETGGYIKSFVNADITAPPDADDFGVNTRYRRALFVYKSILAAAGFERPTPGINTKGLFSSELLTVMASAPEMKTYAEHLKKNDEMSWDMAQNFCRAFSGWIGGKGVQRF